MNDLSQFLQIILISFVGRDVSARGHCLLLSLHYKSTFTYNQSLATRPIQLSYIQSITILKRLGFLCKIKQSLLISFYITFSMFQKDHF